MRGLRSGLSPAPSRRRYNPAYAGTTLTEEVKNLNVAIQPRVCGDYNESRVIGNIESDTTPRMRGLLSHTIWGTLPLRYNPAYAGTTLRAFSRSFAAAIQPRVCGDYLDVDSIFQDSIDTTPRMRGLPASFRAAASRSRYNPAYAGTTVEDI